MIGALFFIHVKPLISQVHPNPLYAIKEGINYAFSHPLIRMLLIFTGVISIFGWPITTILPIIARNSFHVGPDGLGYLYAASGLGSVLAAILVPAFSRRFHPLVY